MARFVCGVVLGLAFGLVVSARASDTPDENVLAAAANAGVDPMDLLGAVNTTGMDPLEYLYAVGELERPLPAVPTAPVAPPPRSAAPSGNGWPIGGALGQRIYCIERIESSHGVQMWNPVPLRFPDGRWYHAHGWLGFMDPTAMRWGAVVGNRWSEWQAAARMIRAGYGNAFYGIQAGLC